MKRYRVYFLEDAEDNSRVIQAKSHREAYDNYLLDYSGEFKKYPIETHCLDDKTLRKWNDHLEKYEKLKAKDTLLSAIKAIDESLCKRFSYVLINNDLRKECEEILIVILKKNLNAWSRHEKKFYLLYSDYPGRKEYLNELAENKKTHINEIMIKKMDAALQLLVNIADSQSANNKKLGKMADGAKMSSILSAIALQNEMSED